MDTVRVKYFLMTGNTPDPDKDSLLGEDVTVSSGKHAMDFPLEPGVYSIYLIGVDKAGNVSKASRPVRIEIKNKK